jgi:excinuclease UvrABC ATPase subunit
MVDEGATVVVVEHRMDVVAAADHVVDLGPGAGPEGGRVVFEGTPAQLAGSGRDATADALRAHLAG